MPIHIKLAVVLVQAANELEEAVKCGEKKKARASRKAKGSRQVVAPRSLRTGRAKADVAENNEPSGPESGHHQD